MDTTEDSLAMKLTPSTPSPNSKLDSGTGSKPTGNPHNRRPAGGTFRPLPSPGVFSYQSNSKIKCILVYVYIFKYVQLSPCLGTAVSASHHILTISDLDETRRSRRLRSRNASPPHTSPSRPMKLCSGSGLHPRSLPFSSPVSPLGSHENPISTLTPRRRGRPPSSPSGATSAYSPRQGAVASPPSTFVLSPCHSPKIQQHLRITPQESAEIPQDFSASLEPEDAAGMPEEGISMIAVMNDCDTVPLSSDHELLSTQFDTDSDVAVASVLNEKLEFDEALLNENVALHFDQHGSGAEQGQGLLIDGNGLVDENQVSGTSASRYSSRIKDFSGLSAVEEQMEQESTNEGSDHYFNFSRTVVVCDSAKDSAQTGLTLLPTSQSISQLDGADNNSESDAGEASGEDSTQDVGNSYQSQDISKGTASVRNHSGSRLVCTSKDESFVMESVHMESETNMVEKFQDSAFLDISSDVINSIGEVFAPQEGTMKDLMVQDLQLTPDADVQDVVSSSPVLDTSSDLLVRHEEVLMDSEPVEHLNEVVLDPISGDFVSAQNGSLVNVCDSSALGGHDNGPEQTVIKDSVPLSSVGKVRIISSGSVPHRSFIISQPVTQRRVVNVAVPAVTSLPFSFPVNNVSTSPAVSVFPQRNHVVTSSPIVINGLDSQLKDATKSRPLAIRLPTSAKTSVTGTLPSPQVLLVNRSGQILIKDPQTNSYQIPSVNSPSYGQISQIAKIIHSQNLVHGAVPRVMVTPISQASPSQGSTTHVISYTNGATPSTKVLIRRLPRKSSAVQMVSGSMPKGETSGIKLKNVSVPSTQVLGRIQGEDAQAIIERAMASHRDIQKPCSLSPSHVQVHPFLNKLQSPESPDVVKLSSGLHNQTKPNILTHSRPQVRVKRVSSASERTGLKQCKTTSIEPKVLSSQDELNRLVRLLPGFILALLSWNHKNCNVCQL